MKYLLHYYGCTYSTREFSYHEPNPSREVCIYTPGQERIWQNAVAFVYRGIEFEERRLSILLRVAPVSVRPSVYGGSMVSNVRHVFQYYGCNIRTEESVYTTPNEVVVDILTPDRAKRDMVAFVCKRQAGVYFYSKPGMPLLRFTLL